MKWRLNELMGEYQAATGQRLRNEDIHQETGITMSTISALRNGQPRRTDLDVLDRLITCLSNRLGRPLTTADLLEYTPDTQ